MDRSAFLSALKNVAMEVTFEEMNEYYKSGQFNPIYTKLCKVRKISEMNCKNYHQTSSIIGSTELFERAEGAPVKFEDAQAGYDIYIVKKSFDLGMEVTEELDEGIPQAKNFLRQYMREKAIPQAITRTKEKFIASFFNKGAYTAGSEKPFNNALAGVITPSYGNFIYDGKPLFALSGNNHAAKAHSTTYYNAIASTLSYDNMCTADTLFTATNAKMENGEPFDNTMDNYLMVNPALRNTAKKILESEYNPSNANNDKNVLRGNYELIVNPYFTNNSNAGWILGNKLGLVLFDSDSVDFRFWDVNETRKMKASAHLNLAAGIVNWRAFCGANLATS